MIDRSAVALAHAVNIAEVHYYFARMSDERTADAAVADLCADGVIVRCDMDDAFWRDLARLKARGRISIADCFCIALARRESAVAVTMDHHEFDRSTRYSRLARRNRRIVEARWYLYAGPSATE